MGCCDIRFPPTLYCLWKGFAAFVGPHETGSWFDCKGFKVFTQGLQLSPLYKSIIASAGGEVLMLTSVKWNVNTWGCSCFPHHCIEPWGWVQKRWRKPNDELLWDNYECNREWNEVSNENQGKISQLNEAELTVGTAEGSCPILYSYACTVLPLSSPNTITRVASWVVFRAMELVFRWITELKSAWDFCSCLRWSKVAALLNCAVELKV